MTVEEILCQISTFMAAGHETTSSALTWCLYALARAPQVQTRLRSYLLTIPPTHRSLDDELMKLPYLDWVVREALRVHAPVTTTMRVCAKDMDRIPVDNGFVDKDGVFKDSIEIRRHDIISIPIQAINRSEKVWGKDAAEFR